MAPVERDGLVFQVSELNARASFGTIYVARGQIVGTQSTFGVTGTVIDPAGTKRFRVIRSEVTHLLDDAGQNHVKPTAAPAMPKSARWHVNEGGRTAAQSSRVQFNILLDQPGQTVPAEIASVRGFVEVEVVTDTVAIDLGTEVFEERKAVVPGFFYRLAKTETLPSGPYFQVEYRADVTAGQEARKESLFGGLEAIDAEGKVLARVEQSVETPLRDAVIGNAVLQVSRLASPVAKVRLYVITETKRIRYDFDVPTPPLFTK